VTAGHAVPRSSVLRNRLVVIVAELVGGAGGVLAAQWLAGWATSGGVVLR
jgi:uncharacterized protein (DUF697 family)